jgi:hypothetical protein
VLYEEKLVQEVATLRAQAVKSLGGVSTGLGFFGSPEWVLSATMAVGLFEALLSTAAKKQGTGGASAGSGKSRIA